MTWLIWLALAVIVFTVWALVKRLETRLVLIIAGLVLCFAAGEPMKAFQAFVKGMTNVTLVPAICAAMGFAAAVTAAKCDEHLVALMSAAGTAATAGATFIPLLIRAGIRPAAAAAAVGGGTMCGLLLNPGCAHDIYVAEMAKMDLMAFIGWALPYIVGLVVAATLVNSALAVFHWRDHKAGAEAAAAGIESADAAPAVKVNILKAFAPLVPLVILIAAAVWFPKAGVDVVVAMICGIAYIALVTLMNPGELSKAFFKGMGTGYAQVIGLIVAAGVFSTGLQASGAVAAFIDALKHSNELARWGAAIGPFLMALGTGSGEAAIWAFNQAVTPSAASFGMEPHSLGLLAILAGQFGRTASPLAGAIIIVAGMAAADPMSVAKRLVPGMVVAVILSALIVV